MGLEMIELVMAVEDEFGITIADEEAMECRKVGQLYDLILAKLAPASDIVGCPTAHIFYRLRRALIAAVHPQTARLRPADRLEKLVPRSNRQLYWRGLEENMSLALPPLRPSVFLGALNLLGAAAGFGLIWGIWVLTVGRTSTWHALPLVVGSVVGLMTYAGACGMTRPHYAVLPKGCRTLGDLARAVLHRSYGLADDDWGHSKWTYDQGRLRQNTSWQGAMKSAVWGRTLELLGKELAVDPRHLSPATDFVDDLFV